MRSRQSLRWLSLFGVVVLLVASGIWYWRVSQRAKNLLLAASTSWASGDAEAAEKQASEAWKLDPNLNDAALLAARAAASRNEFSEAADYATRVNDNDPSIHLAALKFLADLYHRRLYRLTDAENTYRSALQVAPDDVDCNAGLANLLGLCGRRSEAIPIVLKLIRLGQASDLLMLLAREDAVVNDVPALEEAHRRVANDPLPLVGLAWHAVEKGENELAVKLLLEAISLDKKLVCARVALAKLYGTTGAFDELAQLVQELGDLNVQANDFADMWIARGRLAEHQGQSLGAIRCYAEAARRAPDSKLANARLAQLLSQNGEANIAKQFGDYAVNLQSLRDAQDRVFFGSGGPRVDELLALIGQYETVGREWEAYGWCQVGLDNNRTQIQLQKRMKQLMQNLVTARMQLVVPSAMPSNAMEIARYPLPDLINKSQAATVANSVVAPDFSLRDDAKLAKLEFRFVNGTDKVAERRMYEFTGGGIGVIDFDLDGRPDAVFTQGTRWPPTVQPQVFKDKLFRNIQGEYFEDVNQLNLTEDGFGQGIAVGDFDSDGFPDIYVAQIGQNRLLHNNGDGTFSDQTEHAIIASSYWTTSCVIADLNGDTFPDLYDVNYVQGTDVFDRICVDSDGQPAMCLPGDFEAAPDCLWINDGQGGFTDGTLRELASIPAGKGLGVMAFDAEGNGQLGLFVANDTTPNFWFQPSSQNSGRYQLSERGLASGLAFSGEGKAKGCMGVAASDVNDDGKIDLLVTNFLNESDTLYLNQGSGQFSDSSLASGLQEPSRRKLGFGTQFLDLDLDGHAELIVANGHIDDLSRRDVPFEMEAQLFTVRNGRFSLQPPTDARPYFREKRLGRSVVKLDWNGDGREDLLVGHLNSQYALLTNLTTSGNQLSLRLVGTQSNRDAIGAAVEVDCGDRRLTAQLTAGDGYQASNQRHLIFGLGNQSRAQRIRIRWPSGQTQELANIDAGSELTIIESR